MTQYGAPAPPPGWYADPFSGAPRYWDGQRWGAYWTPEAYGGWPPPPPQPSTTAAVLAHLGCIFGGFLIPLIVYLVTDRSDVFTKRQAAEGLNFQLTLLIVGFGGLFLAIVSVVVTAGLALIVLVPAFIALQVVGIVWCIKAAIAASRREYWLYPVCIRMVH